MRVVLAEAALDDLAEIALRIAADNVGIARQFTSGLRARALEIGRNPRLYPLMEGLERQGIRRRLHRGYLIFFRENGGRVEILRILHGARDWPALLTGGE